MLTPTQRRLRRRQYNRKYHAQHRIALNIRNKEWRQSRNYDHTYYEAHKLQKQTQSKTYYHAVVKIKRAARLLVIGKVILSNKDIVGNAELRARARRRFGLTGPQLHKANQVAILLARHSGGTTM